MYPIFRHTCATFPIKQLGWWWVRISGRWETAGIWQTIGMRGWTPNTYIPIDIQNGLVAYEIGSSKMFYVGHWGWPNPYRLLAIARLAIEMRIVLTEQRNTKEPKVDLYRSKEASGNLHTCIYIHIFIYDSIMHVWSDQKTKATCTISKPIIPAMLVFTWDTWVYTRVLTHYLTHVWCSHYIAGSTVASCKRIIF